MSLRSRLSNKRALSLIITGLILVVFAFALTLNPARASENFNYNINVNYFVNNDYSTSVKETYNVTNKTSTQYLDSIKVSTPSANISNIKVYYSDGSSIPFETSIITQESSGYKYDYTQIKVNFNRTNVGQGLNWSFVIQYNSPDLVENKGRANVMYIPGISAENRDEYNVSLTVPSSFGQIHGFGKLPKLVSQNDSTKTFIFSKDDLYNNSVQLLFGDSTTYKGIFVYPLKNESSSSSDFEITLPPSTASQTTFVEKLDPSPVSTRVDADGNVIAKYRLNSKQSIDVKADILSDVHYIQYDLANSGTVSDIPQSLKNQYTKPTKYWKSDNTQIKQKAQELTSNKKTVAEKVRAINDYVVQTLNYNNEKIKYNVRQGGVDALNNPNNVVCLEYSDLTISLLRAADIPARMPVGYGYSGDLKKSPAVSDSLHSWVQAYVPNNGWINLDPTWGEKFNNFGISDIDHLAFAIWGDSDSSPPAIVQNGVDTNYQYEDVKLSYVDTIPVVANDAKATSTNWVILPFISINRYQIIAPSNATIFEAILSQTGAGKSKDRDLKTLAPSQKVAGIIFNLGFSFNKYTSMALVDAGTNKALANTNISNNYLPMIVLIGLILSVILLVSMVKLFNNKSKKKTHKHDELKEK
jgi:transglutaminase-like putative cysteine protease